MNNIIDNIGIVLDLIYDNHVPHVKALQSVLRELQDKILDNTLLIQELNIQQLYALTCLFVTLHYNEYNNNRVADYILDILHPMMRELYLNESSTDKITKLKKLLPKHKINGKSGNTGYLYKLLTEVTPIACPLTYAIILILEMEDILEE